MRPAAVTSFRIDATPVTNDMFARFVAITGHVTDAERETDGRAGSLLFAFHDDGPADWRFVDGVSWRRPHGPTSSLDSLELHPVVHVSHRDAEAYADWAGKRLPNEAEWEAAARGGLQSCAYAGGETLLLDEAVPARIWEGDFPVSRSQGRKLPFTAEAAGHDPNGFGLFDMIGNVWEWTADEASGFGAVRACCGGNRKDDPVGRIIKGGSHLCAPNWCQRYRPAARQVALPPTSHIGFRCVD
ncbi:formylglycine-generating enzyme required for sulfatase activity [Sphingomonas endophytica]|uniref:Formylglycine-generating enzyme required for sulfatase activity n=1 Tax=Sphingomonas endophytica TaxID=869719 RepID=A0ABR6N4U2_9SPHN|nr:formylglycine-generating enzyme required for sulfatase activity [Sphingomonas endophytica]